MAHIRKRKLADGSTAFIVIWTDPAGERQTKQFSKHSGPRPSEAANDFKTKLELELRRGTYVDVKAGDITFREFAERWLADATYRESSYEVVERALRLHILPHLGRMKLSAIRRRDIQKFVSTLLSTPVHDRCGRPGEVLGAATVRARIRITKTIFTAAVHEKLIGESPCLRVELPASQSAEVVIPTPDQVAFVADNVAPHHRALVLLAAGTGLRSSELRGLDTQRLRVLERTVRVDRQLLRSRPGQPRFGPPKSDAGYREVPLAPSYAETAAEHLAEFGTGVADLVLHNLPRTGRPGTQVSRTTVSDVLLPVMRDAGLPTRSGLHVFRHFYASGLIAGGLDVLTVMEHLGHASADETLGTYGHLWHDHDERTRDAIEAAFPAPPRAVGQGALGASRRSGGAAAESARRHNTSGQVVPMRRSTRRSR